jgi:CheY-like chemotaxis protein
MISRLVLAELARSLDHQAEEADDPEQAIVDAVSGRFDVMLVDLSMPQVDGFEILRRLRAREAALGRPPLPVVAVTGHVEPEDHARTRAAGFAGHLDKPVLRQTLQQMLTAVSAAG